MAPGMGPVDKGRGGKAARGAGDAHGMLMLAQGFQTLQTLQTPAAAVDPLRDICHYQPLSCCQSTKRLSPSAGRAPLTPPHHRPQSPPPFIGGKLREVWREAQLPQAHKQAADLWEIPSWPTKAPAALSCLL